MLKANTMRVNEMIEIFSETKGLESALDAKQSSLVSLIFVKVALKNEKNYLCLIKQKGRGIVRHYQKGH